MPAKVDAPERECVKCGRVGTQRYEKNGPRSSKYRCSDDAACTKRAAKRANAKAAAKKAAKSTRAAKVADNVVDIGNGRAKRTTAKAAR